MPDKPRVFAVSAAYIEWAHEPPAQSGVKPSEELVALPVNRKGQVEVPLYRKDLLYEIRDVAELYVGGKDTDLRAARVLARVRRVLYGV